MRNLRDLFVALALVAGLLGFCATARAQGTAGERTIWQGEVVGYGTTISEARNDALDQACTQLRQHLTSQYPRLSWAPEPAYLSSKGLVRLKGDPVEKAAPGGSKLQEVTFQVTLGESDLRAIEVLHREQLRKNRLRLVALVLAGLVAGLLVLKGYLWLEELTRGYSSGLLRTAAIVIIGLVIAVLIWLA